ncbi:MAG: VWA domain-containing protein [Epsilonproteobacteria bacterium]|nr:VWA domain-containing protein [Campylobacterota bacterium]
MHAGDVLTVNYNYINTESSKYAVDNVFDDYAVVVVDGVITTLQNSSDISNDTLDYDNDKDVELSGWQTFTYTATTDGYINFGLAMLNAGDSNIDSYLMVDAIEINGTPANQTTFDLNLDVNLADTDGSEYLSVVLSDFPVGTTFSVGSLDTNSGNWIIDLAPGENLTNVEAILPEGYSGEFSYTVDAVATELSNGDTASATQQMIGSNPVDILINVDESNLSNGTAPDANALVSSGVLENVVSVDGINPDANGIITIDTGHSILEVDTINGTYTYTLTEATTEGVDDQDSFTYTLNDNSTGNIGVNIADDTPNTPSAIDVNLHIEPIVTNLSIIVDGSGSMDSTDLQLSMDAINELVARYSEIGTVHINIVQFFEGSATNTGWISSTDDVTLTSGGRTDIDQGLQSVIDTSFDGTEPVSDQNIVYFFGDGDDNTGTFDTTNWTNFVNSGTIDKLFTYSVNTESVPADIVEVADNGEDVVSEPAVNIADIADLASAVSETANAYIEGNLIGDSTGTAVIEYGADGVHIESVTVNGNTVIYDANNIVQEVNGAHGVYTINMDTGEYTYRATDYIDHQEALSVSVIDGDGDLLDSVILNVSVTFDETFKADAPTLAVNIGDGTYIDETTLFGQIQQIMHLETMVILIFTI